MSDWTIIDSLHFDINTCLILDSYFLIATPFFLVHLLFVARYDLWPRFLTMLSILPTYLFQLC